MRPGYVSSASLPVAGNFGRFEFGRGPRSCNTTPQKRSADDVFVVGHFWWCHLIKRSRFSPLSQRGILANRMPGKCLRPISPARTSFRLRGDSLRIESPRSGQRTRFCDFIDQRALEYWGKLNLLFLFFKGITTLSQPMNTSGRAPQNLKLVLLELCI